MKKKNAWIVVAAAAMLSLALLAGCSESGGSSSSSSDGSSSAASSAASSSSAASDEASSSSSSANVLTADRLFSIESVETAPDKHYTHDYVSYEVDVTMRNISDGTINVGGSPVEDVTVDYVLMNYLDANGNIVGSGVAWMGNGSVTIAQGQSSKFQTAIETGKGIAQVQVTGVDIELGGQSGEVDFTDPSSLVFPVTSPLGTVD